MRTAMIAAFLLVAAATAHAADTPIEAEIKRLSQPASGTVGVAAWRLDGKGQRLLVNNDERFPLASTFKIAVAGAVLHRVDAGEIKLDQMIAVEPSVMVPSDVIADRFIHPGVALSVYNLLELMLTQSDNTATDVMTKTAGGAEAVTAWLRTQGVNDQRVDRDTAGLLRDFYGLPAGGSFMEAYEAGKKAHPDLAKKSALPDPAFDNDPRDTTTPEAMGVLLTRIFTGKALKPDTTKVLTDIMERCRTGDARLRGRLPPGTKVADKTGTIGGTVNDVGVITLPDGAGQIVVAVFVKKSTVPFAAREKVIAEIARSVRDFYLFSGAARS
jgi:beta-lactamase class A